jgi:hypothetical protein
LDQSIKLTEVALTLERVGIELGAVLEPAVCGSSGRCQSNLASWFHSRHWPPPMKSSYLPGWAWQPILNPILNRLPNPAENRR